MIVANTHFLPPKVTMAKSLELERPLLRRTLGYMGAFG